MTAWIPLPHADEAVCFRCHRRGIIRFPMDVLIPGHMTHEVHGYYCNKCGIYTDAGHPNFPMLAVFMPKPMKPAMPKKASIEQVTTRWRIYQVKNETELILYFDKEFELVLGTDPATFIFSRYGLGDFVALEFVGCTTSLALRHLLAVYHICTKPRPQPIQRYEPSIHWLKRAGWGRRDYTADRMAGSFWDYLRTQPKPQIGRPKDTADDSVTLKAHQIHAHLMKARGKSYRGIWYDVYREIYNLPKDATLSWPQIQAAKALGDAVRKTWNRQRLKKR